MRKSLYNVAILGATGNVGRLLLEILEERKFPINKLRLFASPKSKGQIIESKSGKKYIVEAVEDKSFESTDIVFASAGAKLSQELAPLIVKAGAVLIDNSSAFRMDDKVPLVVPEVNGEDVFKHQGIIANPNCSTAPLVLALKALDDKFKISRVVVSTYQSVSGAGKPAMDELQISSAKALQGEDHEYKYFAKAMAFNLIPQIDVFLDNGYTKEEMKLINESRKMLHRPDLQITCTAVRVPVFIGHSESVNVEFVNPTSIDEIKKIWQSIPSLVFMEDLTTYPSPREVAGKDPVYLGRLRVDESRPRAFNFWLVSDNLRIGAALNTIKIAEKLFL